MPRVGGTVAIRSCTDGKKCYDGAVELCTPSSLLSDRVDPIPALGNELSASQYYNTASSSGYPGSPGGFAENYDTDIHGLRDKTAIELGLCAEIPQGTCAEQTNYSKDNGYAYWPSVNLGQYSTGTCQANWIPVSPLTRKCIPFPASQSFGLEPVYRIVRGLFGIPSNEYGNIKCTPN